jgi:hypothetical protein
MENFISLEKFKGQNLTDKKEIDDLYNSGFAAATQLLSDEPGSITRFISLISTNPDNLVGFTPKMSTYLSGLGDYRPDKSTGAVGGAVAGAAGGAAVGGWAGAIVGAALGGFVGWKFIGAYYEEEINCLLKAVDAIKLLSDRVSRLNQKSGGTESSTQEGSRSSSSSGRTPDDVNFMAGILSAAQVEKLAGVPGIDFVNEVKLAKAFVAACLGELNAAEILLEKNTNIAAYISKIRSESPRDISVPITRSFIKTDSGKELLKEMYNTMNIFFKKAVADNKKLGIFNPKLEEVILEMKKELGKEGYVAKASKNNWNKMKKTSESINNQELIRKAAETRVSYFGDANLGLKEQLTKSYYAGLTDMYNEKPQRRSSDYKDLYGFQEETGEDLVLQSHPKSVTLADAMGKGGLVENGLEQKEKSTYVALTTPTGNFQSKYASTIGYLQKLAKAADDQGKKEVSKLIKQTIQNLK